MCGCCYVYRCKHIHKVMYDNEFVFMCKDVCGYI